MTTSSQTPVAKTLVLREASNEARAQQHFLLMDCGEFRLLVPSADVVTFLPAGVAVQSSQSEQDCGYIDYEESRYRVFCLNKNLQVANQLLQPDGVLALFKVHEFCFALACHTLDKLSNNEHNLRFIPVPLCMSSRKQPFTEFAIIEGYAACLTSSDRLLQLLRLRGVSFVVPVSNVVSIKQGAR